MKKYEDYKQVSKIENNNKIESMMIAIQNKLKKHYPEYNYHLMFDCRTDKDSVFFDPKFIAFDDEKTYFLKFDFSNVPAMTRGEKDKIDITGFSMETCLQNMLNRIELAIKNNCKIKLHEVEF